MIKTPALRAAWVAGSVLAASAGAGAAVAHTPYLLPNAFDAERDHVTLEGALTEDDYFRPDIALKVPAYTEITPDGQRQQIAPAAVLKDVAVMEAPLAGPGTYRFTTGPVVGRRMKMALVGGKWLMVRPANTPRRHEESGEHAGGEHRPSGEHKPDGDGPPSIMEADLPADATTMDVENIMISETYVSRGSPTDTAVRPTGEGLEFKPQVHPNAIFVDAGLPFQLTVDGKPVAGMVVDVYREGDVYDDKKLTADTRSDAEGRGKISFERPGVYLLTARSPARVPGEAPSPRSYVYSLTFEVTR